MPRLLSLGDRVRYDGREHTVATLHGTSVRLIADDQAPSVVLLGHLPASDDFAVITSVGPGRPPPLEEGVLEGLPKEAVTRARWWQRHLTELLTGRPDGDPHAPVRAEYDPAVHSLRQRELAKVAELREVGEDVGLSTLQRLRARFENEGVSGPVDGRLRKSATGTGLADPRVVAAIEKVTDIRKGGMDVHMEDTKDKADTTPKLIERAYAKFLLSSPVGQTSPGGTPTRAMTGEEPTRFMPDGSSLPAHRPLRKVICSRSGMAGWPA
ncbi:hypothetical protein [Streptomyces sp. NPDC058751]|uniref:hypothetical protein n=1 Tax=Streptomyces sp. NPDC058751 TaxID=3346623 RepID=UPI0036BD8301